MHPSEWKLVTSAAAATAVEWFTTNQRAGLSGEQEDAARRALADAGLDETDAASAFDALTPWLRRQSALMVSADQVEQAARRLGQPHWYEEWVTPARREEFRTELRQRVHSVLTALGAEVTS